MGFEDIKRITLIPLVVFAMSVFILSMNDQKGTLDESRVAHGSVDLRSLDPYGLPITRSNDSRPVAPTSPVDSAQNKTPAEPAHEPQRLPERDGLTHQLEPLGPSSSIASLNELELNELDQRPVDETAGANDQPLSLSVTESESASRESGVTENLNSIADEAKTAPNTEVRQPPELTPPGSGASNAAQTRIPFFNSAEVRPLESQSFPLHMPAWLQASMSGEATPARPQEPAGLKALAEIKNEAAHASDLPREYQDRWQLQLVEAKALVRKGAMFSAEQHIEEMLLDLANTLDGMNQSTTRRQLVSAGLKALEESSEFFANQPTDPQVDWVRLVAGRHETNLPHVRNSTQMSRVEALQHYYDFGLEALLWGCGHQSVAADAFFTLGRLHQLAGEAGVTKIGHFNPNVAVPVEVVFHQAAMILDQGHYRAANELGVLLGRLGDWAAAREVLRQSVTAHPTPEAWQNLAEAHQRLGEWQLAELARQEAGYLESQATPGTPNNAGRAIASQNNSSDNRTNTNTEQASRKGPRKTFVGIR